MFMQQQPSSFWVNWLQVVSVGVALCGLVLVTAPGLARQGFSLLVRSRPDYIESFGEPAVGCVSLLHAVLGAVMCGWGVALTLVVRRWVARGLRLGWQIVAISAASWFVPDTTYSLLSGYWQNVILNIAFAFLFALPLLCTYRRCDGSGA